jgi:hypothetical protein
METSEKTRLCLRIEDVVEGFPPGELNFESFGVMETCLEIWALLEASLIYARECRLGRLACRLLRLGTRIYTDCGVLMDFASWFSRNSY